MLKLAQLLVLALSRMFCIIVRSHARSGGASGELLTRMESISVAQDFQVARRQVGMSNEFGLHLRVADKFVKLANAFQSEVSVHCKGIIVNGKSILSLLSLAADSGTMLALEAQGCDAEDAVAALANLISNQSRESEDEKQVSGVLEPQDTPDEAACPGDSCP